MLQRLVHTAGLWADRSTEYALSQRWRQRGTRRQHYVGSLAPSKWLRNSKKLTLGGGVTYCFAIVMLHHLPQASSNGADIGSCGCHCGRPGPPSPCVPPHTFPARPIEHPSQPKLEVYFGTHERQCRWPSYGVLMCVQCSPACLTPPGEPQWDPVIGHLIIEYCRPPPCLGV